MSIMKRTKLIKLADDYVSASSIHNYILNDTLVDWLKMYTPVDKTESNYILDQGVKFENKVIEIIRSKLDPTESFVQVYKNPEYTEYTPKDDYLYKKTLDLMAKKTGIIYQGVLHGNDSFKFFGSPDIIIRTDILNKLFSKNKNESENTYSIIDIKFCTLHLNANGETLCNSGRMPANKAQVMIYNKLLKIAGVTSDKCFVLGRGYEYTKNKVNYKSSSFLDRLGVIYTNGCDSFLNTKIEEGYKWLVDLKTEGSKWSIDPPSRKELYPNMCIKYDFIKEKKDLANKNSEITLLWNISTKHRDLCHSKDIFRLDDPRLNTDVMELPDTERSKIIQKMIDFNQNKIFPDSLVIPNKVSDKFDWSKKKVEFYIDFETFSNIFDPMDKMPNKGGLEIVFMIGLVVVGVNCGREYYNFRVNEVSKTEETRIFKEMHKKIDEILKINKCNYDETCFYHWGNIEKNIYNKLIDEDPDLREINFIDLNKIFQNEPILIKGVYDFGLKSVGTALIDLGLIECKSWISDTETIGISNGLEAMVEAYKLYTTSSLTDKKSQLFDKIIEYNEIDCEIMYKIVDYVRRKHI